MLALFLSQSITTVKASIPHTISRKAARLEELRINYNKFGDFKDAQNEAKVALTLK